MKKILYLLITLSILIPAEKAGNVAAVLGKGLVTRGGSGKTEILYENAEIYNGDIVKTTSGAKVEILLTDKSLIRLDSDTVFRINKVKKSRNYFLEKGRIWVSIKKLFKNEKLHFQTPSAIAGVRGTVLKIEILKNNKVRFACEEGEVEVEDKSGKRK